MVSYYTDAKLFFLGVKTLRTTQSCSAARAVRAGFCCLRIPPATRFSSKSCAFTASGNKLLCPIKWCKSSIWGLVQEQKTERIMIIFHNLPFYCFYHCTCSFMEQFGVISFFICVNYFCNYLLQPFLQTQTVYICFFWYVGFEESKTPCI